MNQLSSLNPTHRSGFWAAALAAVFYAASPAFVGASDANAPAAKAGDTKIAQAQPEAKEAAKPKKAAKKQLTGAELYAINCNRCHPERYPTEWSSAHWSTLLLHMRVRANLPAEQARAILKFLQEDSGK